MWNILERISADLYTIVLNLVSSALGAWIGYTARGWRDARQRKKRSKAVTDFFGLNDQHVVIVHSAIKNEERQDWDYPAADVEGIRVVSDLLQLAGLQKGKQFAIAPEDRFLHKDGSIIPSVWNHNLVFLCGPKRSRLVRHFLHEHRMIKYEFRADAQQTRYWLYNHDHNTSIFSSRDDLNGSDSDQQYDFGLIVSMESRTHPRRNVVVLAGIHGVGALGAFQFIADPDNLARLCHRRHRGIIQELVKVSYQKDNPREPEDVDLC